MGAWECQWGTWDCIIRAPYFVHGFLVIQIDGGCHSVHDFFWVQWWGIPFCTNFCFWWFSFCTRFCAKWLPPTSNANFKGDGFSTSVWGIWRRRLYYQTGGWNPKCPTRRDCVLSPPWKHISTSPKAFGWLPFVLHLFASGARWLSHPQRRPRSTRKHKLHWIHSWPWDALRCSKKMTESEHGVDFVGLLVCCRGSICVESFYAVMRHVRWQM